MATNEFNAIYVLESLPDGELQTGRHLSENLTAHAQQLGLQLPIVLATPATAFELRAVLADLQRRAEQEGLLPVLHLEAHGDEDGLQMKNGDNVDWDDLRNVLIGINRATGLNMLVVVAACNGAYLIKTATQLDGAPFWAVIGSEEVITAGQARDGFQAFYRALIETRDGDNAVQELNRAAGNAPPFVLLPAEVLFIRAYAKYIKQFGLGKGLRARIEELVTRAMKKPYVLARGVNWAREQVKAALGAGEEQRRFKGIKARFFFEEQHPANRSRFAVEYSDALRLARDGR